MWKKNVKKKKKEKKENKTKDKGFIRTARKQDATTATNNH